MSLRQFETSPHIFFDSMTYVVNFNSMKRTFTAARRVAKSRPQEVKWSLAGLATGATVGLGIGGVGVAALGSAIGVPAALMLGLVGTLVGNRYGVEKDRPHKQD